MSKGKKIAIIAGGVLLFFVLVGVLAGEPQQQNQNTETVEQPVAQTTDNSPAQEVLDYTLVEEKDVSYAGCKRVTYKIKVADGADINDVKATEEKIIESNKQEWDDITVWTYNKSESDESVMQGIYTVSTSDYSACD